MTRVLVIEAAGNLWGSERALLDLLDGLNNIEVAVCCPPGRALEPELERRRIRVFPTYIYELHKKSRWRRLQAAFGVLWACWSWKPDLIYLNQSGAYRTVLPAAGLLKLPLVAHVRIFEDVDYLARQEPRPSRLRGVIAISGAIREALHAAPALHAIECHTLYDAYALQDVPGMAGERECAMACVGRIVPIKGQDILVEALALLERTGRNLPCLIAGDGDDDFMGQLKESAPCSVTWLGRVGDVLPVLRRCLLSICPSRSEPLGRVIFESWDAGALPIACAQSGGAAEVINASGGGLLYSDNSAQSLAKVIGEALDLRAQERDEMVRKGREWLKSHCDPVFYGAAVSDIFRAAVSESKA